MIDVLLQIAPGHWVNALDITEVRTNYIDGCMVITMRTGELHYARPDNETMSKLVERVVSHINHAARVYSGKVEYREPAFKPAQL